MSARILVVDDVDVNVKVLDNPGASNFSEVHANVKAVGLHDVSKRLLAPTR